VRKAALLLIAIGSLTISSAQATDLKNIITDVTIAAWNPKDGLPSAAR
jgi:hypothetical protein